MTTWTTPDAIDDLVDMIVDIVDDKSTATKKMNKVVIRVTSDIWKTYAESKKSDNVGRVRVMVEGLKRNADDIFRLCGDHKAFDLLACILAENDDGCCDMFHADAATVDGLADRGRVAALSFASRSKPRGWLSSRLSPTQKSKIVDALVASKKIHCVDYWMMCWSEFGVEREIEEAYVRCAIDSMLSCDSNRDMDKIVRNLSYFFVLTRPTSSTTRTELENIDATAAVEKLFAYVTSAAATANVAQVLSHFLVVLVNILRRTTVGNISVGAGSLLAMMSFISKMPLRRQDVVDAAHCMIMLAALDEGFGRMVMLSDEIRAFVDAACDIAREKMDVEMSHASFLRDMGAFVRWIRGSSAPGPANIFQMNCVWR